MHNDILGQHVGDVAACLTQILEEDQFPVDKIKMSLESRELRLFHQEGRGKLPG